MATELQRSQRGRILYMQDEPSTGLHGTDAVRLMAPLHRLVDAGNTVVMIDMTWAWSPKGEAADVAKVRESRTTGSSAAASGATARRRPTTQ